MLAFVQRRIERRIAALGIAAAFGLCLLALPAPTAAKGIAAWGKIAGWTAPTQIDATREMSSVWCAPSTGATWSTFCIAVDTDGYALTFDGHTGSWSTPVKIDPLGLSSVSCAPSTLDTLSAFCVAVNALGIVTYTHGTWSAPASQAVIVHDVACASTSFCVAIGDAGFQGDALLYAGGVWKPIWIRRKESGGRLTSLSCATTTFCAAVGTGGRATIYSGGSWSTPSRIDGYQGSQLDLMSVSCPSSTYCVAVDEIGRALTFDGTSWSQPVTMKIVRAGGPASISCPSPGTCVVVYNSGELLELGGTLARPTWRDLGMLDSEGFDPIGPPLSCPTAGFCAGVDARGGWVFHPASLVSMPTPPG